jgi:uncharacterized protein involved in outer membrane biogenesis
VLPYDRFETDKWQVMDADVRFKGGRIEHGGTLPISDLSTHVILNEATCACSRCALGWPTARLPAAFICRAIKTAAGGGQPAGAAPEAEGADAESRDDAENPREMNGDVQLRGSGNSVAALLGNSNGNLKLLMNDGLISRNLMEILGLNVGNYVIGQIFGDDEVRVNCAAANIDVTTAWRGRRFLPLIPKTR